MALQTRMGQRLACTALSALLTVSLVGCATPPGGTRAANGAAVQLTQAEQKLRADKERFDNTVIGGVIKGAAIGAAFGALSVLATGGNRNDATKGAVVGAVAGGAIGGVDGYKKAKLQQAKMDEVVALQAVAADIRADNGKLQSFLASSATVLDEGKQRLASIRGDVDAKRISAGQAEDARRREEQNIAQMQATLKKAKETQSQYAQASASFQGSASNKRDLDAEIGRMNVQVSTLERNINDYSRALAVSKA